MNFKNLRKQFPILSQKVNKHPLIYFDSASTAQMPQIVLDAITDYYATYKANVGRGIYSFAEQVQYTMDHDMRTYVDLRICL